MKAARALMSALAMAASAALAQTTQPVWVLTEIGPLPGVGANPTTSTNGLNAAGVVVGSGKNATGSTRPWVWQAGVLTELPLADVTHTSGAVNGLSDGGLLVGSSGGGAVTWANGAVSAVLPGLPGATLVSAAAVNAGGAVVGFSTTATGKRAVRWQDGLATDLGDLSGGVDESVASGINRHGKVVGYSGATTGRRAFAWDAGVMTDLGDLPGGLDYSIAYAVNDAGQIAGFSEATNGSRAVLWQNGGMTDLGDLPGGSDFSFANGLNNLGWAVGSSASGLGSRAVLWRGGAMIDLNGLPEVAASGLTLQFARGINDNGQIAGDGGLRAGDAFGTSRSWLLTLTTTVWDSAAGGSWADRANWSHAIVPNALTHAVIDPLASLTVTGPTAATKLLRLTVGGQNGIATLSLGGGLVEVLGSGGQFTNISAKGVLTGEGTLTGAVNNLGLVAATNLTLTGLLDNQGTVEVTRLQAGGGLSNRGLLTGHGTLTGNLTNTATGTVQVLGAQVLTVSGSAHTNAGLVEASGGGRLQVTGSFTNLSGGQVYASGGTLRFDGLVTNAAGGRLQIDDATLRFNGGLANSGQVQVSFGESAVFGAITGNAGGKIILSGNSSTTFYDALDIKSGSELRVSAGSTAVFFGAVAQRTGAVFSGTGTKFYEGGLSIGNSPGWASDSGNVSFGAGNIFKGEISGLEPRTGHDHYAVAGTLSFGGTLQLVSWEGYIGQAGHSFDLFDWGSASGRFDHIDASGLLLAEGTRLDTSRLYLDGSVAITAVPEPAVWSLWLGGLAGLGALTRRRHRRMRQHRGFALPSRGAPQETGCSARNTSPTPRSLTS